MDDALLHWARARLDVAHERAGTAYYLASAGPPQLTLHAGCDGRVNEALRCEHCDVRVDFGDLELVRGPGLAGA